jgi:hypothetical protein
MTSEKICDEFNHVSEQIDHLIQAEVKRLKLLGYSKAHICERSLEIQEWAEKQIRLGTSNRSSSLD